MPKKPSRPDKSALTNVRVANGQVESTVTLPWGVVSTKIPILPNESRRELRVRMFNSLRHEVRMRESAQRRGQWYVDALTGMELHLTRPGEAELEVQSGVIRGIIGDETDHVLLVLQDADGPREVLVTVNKNGRFSVALGTATAISITPVSVDGVLGDIQVI